MISKLRSQAKNRSTIAVPSPEYSISIHDAHDYPVHSTDIDCRHKPTIPRPQKSPAKLCTNVCRVLLEIHTRLLLDSTVQTMSMSVQSEKDACKGLGGRFGRRLDLCGISVENLSIRLKTAVATTPPSSIASQPYTATLPYDPLHAIPHDPAPSPLPVIATARFPLSPSSHACIARTPASPDRLHLPSGWQQDRCSNLDPPISRTAARR